MYKPCPHCGYELCYIDRSEFDECTMCGEPLPDELKEPPIRAPISPGIYAGGSSGVSF